MGPGVGVSFQVERTINAEARRQAGPPPPLRSPPPGEIWNSFTTPPGLSFLVCKMSSTNLTFIYLDRFHLSGSLLFVFFRPCSMWDLTSLTRDRTQAPAVGRRS